MTLSLPPILDIPEEDVGVRTGGSLADGSQTVAEHGPLRLLMIEDNPDDVRLVEEMLAESEAGPFTLDVADCLDAGLDRIGSSRVHALLLDLSLPDAKGLDTFRRARERVPGMPIIVLTGRRDDAAALSALRLSAQDYLVKGLFSADTLRRAIWYAIARKRAEEARREMEALRSLALLARAAAHEINNPLTAVLGNLELLLGQVKADSPAHQRVRRALAGAGRIREVVEHMARITRFVRTEGFAEDAPALDLRGSGPLPPAS